MITGIKKSEFLGKLGANLPQQVSLPVVQAIVHHVDTILGVASARYEKYAEVSATGLRTVERTIPALYRHGVLRKQSRRDGPPVLWLPDIMDMQADEAVRRAGWLAHHKDENPQNYFRVGDVNVAERAHARRASERARDEIDVEGEPKATNESNPSLDTGTQLELREKRRAKAKSPAQAKDQEILRLVHSEWDAQGLKPEDPKALTKAIHATGKSRPEPLKHLDGRAFRKAYQRARARLPMGYDRWIDLIAKWDKSYGRRKARNLVDRLITAVGDRPPGILDKLFDHLEQQICDHLPKKVRRLESECERLKNNKYYVPQLRPLKTDAIREKVYAALADGPKTKTELARMFGLSYGAISSVGLRLRNAGQIKTIWRGGRFMWARADTAPLFVPARDAIVAALKEGPMNVPGLAQKTGKGTSTVKSALHRHLLPNGRVIRATKRGIFALAGTQPPYISKCDAIIAALEKGPMTVPTLAQVTCTTPSSLYQFIDLLLAKGTVIRTGRGIYELHGSAPVYVSTCDAIISALTKKTMKLGALVQRVNRSTKSTRSRGTITTVLSRLIKQGTVKQDRRGGEYRLAGRVRLVSQKERQVRLKI
jgi:DNA-binding transcriptional ArsR family regulator